MLGEKEKEEEIERIRTMLFQLKLDIIESSKFKRLIEINVFKDVSYWLTVMKDLMVIILSDRECTFN